MKLDILSIAKMVSETLRSREAIEARSREAMKEPVVGTEPAGNVRVHLDLSTSRVSKVEIGSIPPTPSSHGKPQEDGPLLSQIAAAVNDALDKADEVWDRLTPEGMRWKDGLKK